VRDVRLLWARGEHRQESRMNARNVGKKRVRGGKRCGPTLKSIPAKSSSSEVSGMSGPLPQHRGFAQGSHLCTGRGMWRA